MKKRKKLFNELLIDFQKESCYAYNIKLVEEIVRDTNLDLNAFKNKHYVDYDDYTRRWDKSDYLRPIIKEPFDIYRVESTIISIRNYGEYIPLNIEQFFILKTVEQNPYAYLEDLISTN